MPAGFSRSHRPSSALSRCGRCTGRSRAPSEHNVAEVIRRYWIFRDLLAAELGLAPSEDLDLMLPAPVRLPAGDGLATFP